MPKKGKSLSIAKDTSVQQGVEHCAWVSATSKYFVSHLCIGKNHKPDNTRSHIYICMWKAELSFFEYFTFYGNINIDFLFLYVWLLLQIMFMIIENMLFSPFLVLKSQISLCLVISWLVKSQTSFGPATKVDDFDVYAFSVSVLTWMPFHICHMHGRLQ